MKTGGVASMKPLFQSRPLHLTACILLFWKGISIIIWLMLLEFGMIGNIEDYFFISTGFGSPFALVVAGAFSESRTFLIVAFAVMCLAFLTFWVFFVLLAINRSSAGFASVGLVVLCVLDLPMTAACSFSQWQSIFLCIVFHAAIFITIALLRRSRPGFSLVLSKIPESI
jgi:hypothetical protein